MAHAFRTSPRPDAEVIQLVERTLSAARQGNISTISISVVNPTNEVENLQAGDLTKIRSTALIGALLQAILSLTNNR